MIEKTTEMELRQETAPIISRVESLTITGQETQIEASELLKAIKTGIKKVKEKLDPICDASFKAHKANTGLRNELTDPLTRAENILKQKLSAYISEQERIQQKKQAEAEAKARAEEEKKRLDLEARAEKWEAKGNAEKAETLRFEAETVAIIPQVVQLESVKVQGIHTVELWGFEITDITQVPREYMIVNELALNALARATKGALQLPGIKFISRKTISARAELQKHF